MGDLFFILLKFLRKLNFLFFIKQPSRRPECDKNPDSVSRLIFEALDSGSPCMIARFGAFELSTLTNYVGVIQGIPNLIRYIKGREPDWRWNKSLIKSMHTNAGFFPSTEENIKKFCQLMINDISEVDILGSWLSEETIFERELTNAKKVRFIFLDPFWATNPWTRALEGKRILVVHPFASTIEQQYKKRTLLFKNNILPEFKLETIKAVQSIAGEKTPFNDWFDALEYMKAEIDKHEYDICLIGCGAYGFPLAAHVKRQGKKSIQLGGSLQLLFGIRGKRWEDPNYSRDYNYSSLINEFWVKPDEKEKPKNADTVEGACYW